MDDGLSEIGDEIVSKRLGLSQTVASQIQRYRDSAARGDGVPDDEAVSVFRLVSRRSDAELAFSDAGRRAARFAARQGSAPSRALLRAAPRTVRRRLGLRTASRVAQRTLSAELKPGGALAEAELAESLATRAAAAGPGCYFYGAAFAELLRLLTGFEGAMVHDHCRARGDSACHWKAALVEGYE